MGKRINLSDLADEPPLQEGRVPAFVDTAPRSAPVDQIAANPLNTRDLAASTAKIASIAESMRVHGQLQPCAVVTRTVFLGIFPEQETAIGNAVFVQVTGGRRRAAAIAAGLPTLDITVKNGLADSRAQFISATAAENIDREDYDPIEEARAVQLLVQECGTGKAAAEQLSRTPPWVTQRLNLLRLAPEVQAAVRAGTIPLREARNMHDLSTEEQLAILKLHTADADAELTAVNSAEVDDPTASAAKVPRPRLSPAASAIRKLGGTPSKIAATLRSELPPQDLKALVEELLRDA